MALLEEYSFWKVASFFINIKEYRILHLSKNQNELWLEKTESSEVQVVRLLLHNLDWSNWMQRDIEMTSANGERIRTKLGKREISILNLYFSAYPPVDDYEFRLEKPFFHPEYAKVSVKSLLVDRAKFASALENIDHMMGGGLDFNFSEDFSDQDVEKLKHDTLTTEMKRMNEEQSQFNYGKPFFTYLFIGIQLLVYLLMEVFGSSTDTSTLIQFGAKFNPLILEGEWWRFLTPIFIHIGLLHLAMNTLALYYLGTLVEQLYGKYRFLLIYLAAGFAGSLASFIFSPNLSAGASGAIFGCFGALLFFGVVNPRLFWRTLGMNIFIVLAINLVFGFTAPGIDNAGHIGGLIGGFAASGILQLPNKKNYLQQSLFFVVFCSIAFALLQYGFSDRASVVDQRSILVLAQKYINEEEFEKANHLLNDYIQKEEATPETLFLLSFSEIKQGELSSAKNHLFQVIQAEPEFHEAYFNLALLFMDEKNLKEAQKYAEHAVELQPNKKSYQDLLSEINHDLESSVLE